MEEFFSRLRMQTIDIEVSLQSIWINHWRNNVFSYKIQFYYIKLGSNWSNILIL